MQPRQVEGASQAFSCVAALQLFPIMRKMMMSIFDVQMLNSFKKGNGKARFVSRFDAFFSFIVS